MNEEDVDVIEERNALESSGRTKDFLLAEYKWSTDMVVHIDNRRATFLNYYAVIFTAAVSIAVGVLARDVHPLPFYAKVALAVLFGSTACVGLGVVGVLRSERAANVRYRKRINMIRELMCAKENDLDIDRYLAAEKHEPSGRGQTLGIIFKIIGTQAFIATVSAVVAIIYAVSDDVPLP